MRIVEIDIVTNVGALQAYVDRTDSYSSVRRLDLTQGDEVQFELRFFSKSGFTFTRVDLGETADVELICRNIADFFGDPLFETVTMTRTADATNWKWVGVASLDTVRIANSIVSATRMIDAQTDVISTVSGSQSTYANISTRIKQSAHGLNFADLDLSLSGLADNDLLEYDSATGQWNNITPAQWIEDNDLDEVDNTSDIDKPVSTAQQAAIDQAEADAIATASADATAKADAAEAAAIQRANHTGTQLAATISDFDAASLVAIPEATSESIIAATETDDRVSSRRFAAVIQDFGAFEIDIDGDLIPRETATFIDANWEVDHLGDLVPKETITA